MKKLFVMVTCLILLVLCVSPVNAWAAEQDEDIIHFLNPTAITIVGDHLYVADKIEENRSAILCFQLSGDQSIHKTTLELDETVTNLSSNGSDVIYAVTSSGVLTIDCSDADKPALAQTRYEIAGGAAVDFTYGTFGAGKLEYMLTDSQLLRNTAQGSGSFINVTQSIDDPQACYALGDYIYYLYKEQGASVCKRYNGVTYTTDTQDVFNKGLNLAGMEPVGLFGWENDSIAIYDSKNIYFVDVTKDSCSLIALMFNYNQNIVDIDTLDGKIYLLNDNNQIEIYAKNSLDSFELAATIGSDTVHRSVPDTYTSFTLARSVGYPTNIVYKTVGDNSVDNIVTNADEYIILGFDGDADARYYYVLVGDRFGWVKKSENATGAADDDRIQIIDTSVGQTSVSYKTKFNSLNAVYIYDLPRENGKQTVYNQNADSLTEVTVLQKFTEQTDSGSQVWYLVEYDKGLRGFVKEEAIGRFYLSVNVEETSTIGQRKINSTMFEAVTVYETADLDKTRPAYTSDGEVLKLHSGDRVLLIETYENGAALVQIVYSDGTAAFGYVDASRLIDVHSMTTNAIVGLSLVGVALVIAIVLIAVYLRKKKKTRKRKFKTFDAES